MPPHFLDQPPSPDPGPNLGNKKILSAFHALLLNSRFCIFPNIVIKRYGTPYLILLHLFLCGHILFL